MELNKWPPEYRLRISKKARHVHLKILPGQGLEVVVPIRQQKRLIIADLLDEKKIWIEKHLANVKPKVSELITVLPLRAIDQIWKIAYIQTLSSQLRYNISIGEKISTITVYGDVSDIPRTHLLLKKWLKLMAVKYLVPYVQELSTRHKLPFNKVAIRAQRTLWGSCTRQKNISLNYKLLFIPANYAQHIMLHELCHTKHLNHSNQFWNLLLSLDPDTIANDKALRDGDNFIPHGL